MSGSHHAAGAHGQPCLLTGSIRLFWAFAALLYFDARALAQDIDIHNDMPEPVGVPSSSPTDYPWIALGRVVSKAGFCGGVLIGDDRVLTASHCVRDNGTWLDPSGLTFLAGFSGGKFQLQSRVRTYAVANWNYREPSRELGEWRADWALLKLVAPLGHALGSLRLTSLRERSILAYGKDLFRFYHGAFGTYETPKFVVHRACVLMRVYGSVGIYLSDCPARPGDSGSPLLLQEGAKFVLAGLYIGRTHNNANPYTVLVSAEAILRDMPRVEMQLTPPEGKPLAAAQPPPPAPPTLEKNALDPTRWSASRLFSTP